MLGPKGPHQSICGGKTDCVVNLIERSLAAPGSVYNGLEFERTKFKGNDAVGFANDEYPGIKLDTLLRLLLDLAIKWTGLVWTVDICGETNNSGPGSYGNKRSGIDVLLLHW